MKDENDKILSYEEKPQVPKGNLAVPPFYCYLAKDAARLSEALDAGCKALMRREALLPGLAGTPMCMRGICRENAMILATESAMRL